LFGIEPDSDISKILTRGLISGFLKEETSKETKDEEKIKKLKREWLLTNGSKGISYFKKLFSVLAEIYPPLDKAMPDIIKELENWEQLIKKSIRSSYLPSMSKKLRETIIRVEFIQKAMTTSFYTGIILITLSSAFSFLEIDLIDMIRNLFKNIAYPTLYPLA
jgi:hypothetical protein